MHEMSIVTYVLDEVKKLAKENDLHKIHSVTLVAGEVSMVVPRFLSDCWDWMVKKDPLTDGCKLIFEETKAHNHCNACGKDYLTVPQGKICPFCGSPDTVLKDGNELIIKSIEAE